MKVAFDDVKCEDLDLNVETSLEIIFKEGFAIIFLFISYSQLLFLMFPVSRGTLLLSLNVQTEIYL